MKTNKIIKLVIVSMVLILATSCSFGKKEIKKLKTLKSGINRVEIYGKGNRAYSMKSKTKIDISKASATTKKIVKKKLKELDKDYKNITGVTHRMKFTDDTIFVVLTVDFRIIQKDMLKKISRISFEKDMKKGVNLDELVKELKKDGFK